MAEMFTAGGFEISRAHMAALAAVARSEREEREAAEAAAEAASYRSAMLAPAFYETMEIQRTITDAEAARAERRAQQAREQHRADAEEYREHLLRTGQGRWRTVAEVLAAARGVTP
jgi:hypothetical protein